MKKILIVFFAVLFLLGTTLSIGACANGNNVDKDAQVIEQYEGKWYCYQIVSGSNTVDFKQLASLINVELSIQISSDKTYICHYYLNGKETGEYPQEGTFTVSENNLLLDGDITGRAQILEGKLILVLNDVTQYFQRESL